MEIKSAEIRFVLDGIKASVEKEVKRIVEEEICESKKNIEMKLNKEIDSIVLKCLHFYKVSGSGENIVIEVKKLGTPNA